MPPKKPTILRKNPCDSLNNPSRTLLHQQMQRSSIEFREYHKATRTVMRRYLHHDAGDKPISSDPELHEAVQGLHRRAGNLLADFSLNQATCFATSNICGSHGMFRGAQAELMFDTLIFSHVRARPNDPMFSIPTSGAFDGLAYAKDKEGQRTGKNRSFDRWVVRRVIRENGQLLSREPVKVEVKSAASALRRISYEDDILPISMEMIAGDKFHVPTLQRALIEHSRDNSQYAHIVQSAYDNFRNIMNRHIDKQQPVS